ncbi:deoxyribodipyrimidine photo-lyase [Flavilitoribacter nigricans]|uniref:Deoxyribodipyrimidine photo-lyase n=1 Tax=Flavilitoribacter nigricans (strain ATCC 23147 / DSM 23189 / NBRC 102662 / NCIMB 1420 / SS-2) TaxID=1122177 RepID=A0A2D0NIM7_FLAN2|nr:deoxyribodipyrimidine photo-lyase [Flavilitoribacter nigricans]PHN08298.1 deoxyribodipyrimidine photolyase [Flavilitoribacter nigricans DSM 23189 = NBRC 102662]
MEFTDIHPDRVQVLNDHDLQSDRSYVLYWMQQSQRAEWNHAFEAAIRLGRQLDKPVLVGFGLMDDYPEANIRHYTFMTEGLVELDEAFKKRDCKLVIKLGHPRAVIEALAKDAAAVVCDRGYLRHQEAWRSDLANSISCPLIQVESDLIIPVEAASNKREYAARTIRSQLQEKYRDYLEKPARLMPPKSSVYLNVTGEDIGSVPAFLEKLKLDDSVPVVSDQFKGGTSEAKRRFRNFLKNHLDQYNDDRNQPHEDHVSHMSPYLHFGQISPVWLIREIEENHSGKDAESYVEELLVRRELAANFCFYEKDYDRFSALPDWARTTLNEHKDDERKYRYTREEMENAETHDEYWNAAMQQMKKRGYLHNHMRMYWGKQILAWTNTPKYAYRTALYLNNKYFLDGRDCNSFANIGWLFGLHDRAWNEREVFGKVRIMTKSGLERKTDPDKFIDKVED